MVYAYDNADNLNAAPGGTDLDYDAANQLTRLTRASKITDYAYDNRGNRTSATPKVGTAMCPGVAAGVAPPWSLSGWPKLKRPAARGFTPPDNSGLRWRTRTARP